MATLIGRLSDGRDVYQNDLPLGAQIEDFKKEGIAHPYLAMPADVALIRIEKISDDWSRTSMMPIKSKGKPTILTRTSEFMTPLMVEVITEAHRNNRYSDIFPEDFYEVLSEKAEAQSSMAPEDREVHILEGLTDNKRKLLLTPEMEDTKFIFGAHASRYFEIMNHHQIPFYDLPDVAPKRKAIANFLWFDESRDGSGLSARYWNLDLSLGYAFGVRSRSAEGTSQKNKYDSIKQELWALVKKIEVRAVKR